MKFESVRLHDQPTEDEWYRLSIFRERTEELIRQMQQHRLKDDLVMSFSRKPDGTYQGSGTVPANDDIRLMYFEFRHLYAEQEPGNFFRALRVISLRSGDERVVRCMKHLKHQARSSIVESGFFHNEGRKLSAKQLIDTWFYARLFHSDRERRDELEKLNQWLSRDGVRILLFHAIRDGILAAKNLYWLIQDLRPGNEVILLPEEFWRGGHGSA